MKYYKVDEDREELRLRLIAANPFYVDEEEEIKEEVEEEEIEYNAKKKANEIKKMQAIQERQEENAWLDE